MSSNGTETIEQDGQVSRLEGKLTGTSLNDAAEAFKDTYNNTLAGVVSHQQANQLNRSLMGMVQTRKVQMDYALKAKIGEELVQRLAKELIGITEGSQRSIADKNQ
jgi:hypothetical protein